MDLLKASLDYLIFGALGLMSVLMVWFAVERWLYLRQVDLSRFRHADELYIALTRHTTALYTVGANAPYVGLLGTVIGILITFYDLSQTPGTIAPGAIMLGLALALKATAAGLAVAIPAIVLHNAIGRRVEELTAQWRQQQP